MVTRAYKVDTDCRDIRLGVSVVGESQEQAGLSNTGVSDEEQLEEVVVSGSCQQRCPRWPSRSHGVPVQVAGQWRGGEALGVGQQRRTSEIKDVRKRAYHSGFMMTELRSARQMWVLGYALGQLLSSEACDDKGMAEG